MEPSALHVPVLYQQALAGLNVTPGGCYIDATVGVGGHAEGVLRACAPDGRLLGMDADPQALEVCRKRLAPFGKRAVLVHANFCHLDRYARAMGFCPVDGVLFDLGVSSLELATPERGFSFQVEGPLDMRFDPTAPGRRTAGRLVNALLERELAELIYRYGEEPAARSIARAIVAARPLRTTTELAQVIARAVRPGRRRAGIHPATRTFQALRIAVNDELRNLEAGLEAALKVLKPGGRLAVIAFHSLEDRIVKRFLAREARDCLCPPEALVCTCGHRARVKIITKKPIRPDEGEVRDNPRSRSARLRIAVKV